jgi:16S rRNA processing protein RimM
VGTRVYVDGAEAEVVRRAGTEERPIIRLAGRDSREQADALRGMDLWVRRSDLPPLGEDEWYAEDLEGCRVLDGEREVGVVSRLLAYPSCEVLEVRSGDRELLIPLISDAVRDVDVAARRIDVDLSFLGEEA